MVNNDMPNPAISLSIIIPTQSRRAELERCLTALGCQENNTHPFEVLVIDDHSKYDVQKHVAAIARNFPALNIRVYPMSRREQGAAAARNLGLSYIVGEIVGFLDDDSYPCSNWVSIACGILENAPEGIAGITGRIVDRELIHPLSLFRQSIYDERINKSSELADRSGTLVNWGGYQLIPIDYMAGGNSVVRAKIAKSIGGFDHALPMMHDKDLAYRILASGYKFYFSTALHINHDNTKSTYDTIKKAFYSGKYHYILDKRYGFSAPNWSRRLSQNLSRVWSLKVQNKLNITKTLITAAIVIFTEILHRFRYTIAKLGY